MTKRPMTSNVKIQLKKQGIPTEIMAITMTTRRRRCPSSVHSTIWPRQSNTMIESIHKLENERDDSRRCGTTSNASRIKFTSHAFAVTLKSMEPGNRSSTKSMSTYLICSNEFGRRFYQCTILIYDDGLLNKLWKSPYTTSSLSNIGCTHFNTNTILSRARWQR